MKLEIKDRNDDGEREVDIRIDDQDLWSLDHTLSLIILPCLQALRKDSVPYTHKADGDKEYDGTDGDSDEIGDFSEGRWNYIVGEMIWSFEQIKNDEIINLNDYEEHSKRVQRGLDFFGKYYQALWS